MLFIKMSYAVACKWQRLNILQCVYLEFISNCYSDIMSQCFLHCFSVSLSLSSLVKSADTGNGVSFHSGDNVTMDLEPQTLGVSFIDRAMQLVNVLFCVDLTVTSDSWIVTCTQHIFLDLSMRRKIPGWPFGPSVNVTSFPRLAVH